MMNKKRLAALAMSAVMAAGTVSIPVNAADFSDGTAVQEEVAVQSVDVTEDAADGVASPAYVTDAKSANFDDETGWVVYYKKPADGQSGEAQKYEGQGTLEKDATATCEHGTLWHWTYTDPTDGTVMNSMKYEKDDKKDHEYIHKVIPIEGATCTTGGQVKKGYVCENCGDEKDMETVDIEPTEHSWGADKYRIENRENLNEDLELIDESIDGTYDRVTYHVCEVCGTEEVTKTEHKTVNATGIIRSKSVVTDQKGIVTNLIGMTKEEIPELDDIELEECDVAGSYTLTHYDANGKVINVQTGIPVKVHHFHVYAEVKFANEEDAKLCTVTKDKDGNPVVTNNSCVKDIEYTVITKCSAEGCPEKDNIINRENETAIRGEHSIDTEAYKALEAIKKSGDRVEFSVVEAYLNDYVEVTGGTATCEKAGTVDITFNCQACDNFVKKIEGIEVKAMGHVAGDPVNIGPSKKPDCQNTGKYTVASKCERCGEVLEETKREVIVPRTAHTNEVSVDNNGVGVDDTETIDETAAIEFVGNYVVDPGNATYKKGMKLTNYAGTGSAAKSVYANIYTNCKDCDNHKVKLTGKDVTVKITDVKKETWKYVAGKKVIDQLGSITLEATYKYTENGETKSLETKTTTAKYLSADTPYYLGTGLYQDTDGVWRYYIDGDFAEDYSGIVNFDDKQFVVANGVLCQDASGLTPIDDEWYYLTEGRIRTDVTQVVMYDGEWFYVVNGKLDRTVDDLVLYDGETFVFVDGRLAQEGNGLWIGEEGVWYFLSNGRVAKEHTGLAMYDNEWFYVVNGKLAVDYNGTVEYNGGTFKVVGGMVKEQIK